MGNGTEGVQSALESYIQEGDAAQRISGILIYLFDTITKIGMQVEQSDKLFTRFGELRELILNEVEKLPVAALSSHPIENVGDSLTRIIDAVRDLSDLLKVGSPIVANRLSTLIQSVSPKLLRAALGPFKDLSFFPMLLPDVSDSWDREN